MGVPYALVLGTIGGVLEFVPVVGPLAGALTIVTVALLMSYQHWLILIIFLGIWRLVQDYVSSPRIMGESMELHPLAAIFGVMAGGEVAGILGIYLSIPVMASLRIVFRRWRLYAEKKKFGPLTELPCAPRRTGSRTSALCTELLLPQCCEAWLPSARRNHMDNRHIRRGQHNGKFAAFHRSRFDALLPRPRSDRLIHGHLAQKFRRGLGQHRVDEHSRSQLESRHARQPRNHAHIPVEVPRPAYSAGPLRTVKFRSGFSSPT